GRRRRWTSAHRIRRVIAHHGKRDPPALASPPICRTAIDESLSASGDEQHCAGDRDCDARPTRDNLRLLFRDGEFERSELSLVRSLGVLEMAVEQAEEPGDEEHEPEYFHATHSSFLLGAAVTV